MYSNIFSFISFAFLLISVIYLAVYLILPRRLKVPLIAVSGVGIFIATFMLFVPINLVASLSITRLQFLPPIAIIQQFMNIH